MLKEGRTLREVLRTAALVYGPVFENFYARQDAYLKTLGVLRGRAWGDNARAEEIRRMAARVVRGEVK